MFVREVWFCGIGLGLLVGLLGMGTVWFLLRCLVCCWLVWLYVCGFMACV